MNYVEKLINNADDIELRKIVESSTRRLYDLDDEAEQKSDLALLGEFETDAQEFLDKWGKFQGISSGLQGVDDLTYGMVKGELVILGGSPGTGKSALLMNIAANIAESGKMVCITTLELTHAQVTARVAKAYGEGWQELPIVLQREQYIDRRHLKKIVANAVEGGAEVIIIDYIQMLSAATENEHAEIASIVRELKRLAIDHNILVIAVSSLNRKREDEELTMKSLHGSAKLEYFADIILFLQRTEANGKVEVKIVKNRSRKLDWDSNSRILRFDGAKFSD